MQDELIKLSKNPFKNFRHLKALQNRVEHNKHV